MSHIASRKPIVLSLAPSTRGFGFAVFEGRRTLLDWGVRHIKRDKNQLSVAKARLLIERYQPEEIVLEDYAGPGSWRRPRVRSLIRMFRRVADKDFIEVHAYSRGQIRDCFAPSERPNKYEIAQKIVVALPELRSRLPKKRRPWTPENPYMALFDAVALALCHFHTPGS